VCSIMRGRQVIGVENSLIFPGIFRNSRERERVRIASSLICKVN
jgi:hypothetical protein